MVLNDWKNIGASKIAQRWNNKKIDSHITIYARNPIFPNGSGIADNTLSAWNISIYKNNQIRVLKTFETKTEALAYAKEYMSKH